MALRGRSQHSFNCTWDAREGDASFEECFYRHFVSGIECNGVVAAHFGGLVSKAEAGESLKVGLLKVEVAECGKIKCEGRCRALRIRKCVEDG
jgi:hypothetical protein